MNGRADDGQILYMRVDDRLANAYVEYDGHFPTKRVTPRSTAKFCLFHFSLRLALTAYPVQIVYD